MKVVYLISLLLTLSFSVSGFQEEPLPNNERVYLSLDKPYHAAGEHVGFTIYLLDRLTHRLQESPRIVYLELFHPQGDKLLSQVIQTERGLAVSRLLLPDTLSGGIYQLAAYTQRMAQEEEPAIAWKEIVVDGEKTLNSYVPDRGDSPQLSFFPEGGKLVERLDNLVGVRLMDANSNDLATEGEILNNKGELAGTFSTSGAGVGSFALKPEAGLSYYGRLKLNGRTIEARLPQADAEGMLLKVDDHDPDSLRIAVAATPSFYGEKFKLQILTRGITILETVGQARHYEYKIKVPVNSLLPGVAYVQLLSAQGDLLANRPVYLNEQQRYKVTISTSEDRYPVRTKVALRVQLTSEDGRPLKADFSASVFNKQYAMTGGPDKGIQQQILVAAETKSTGAITSLPSPGKGNREKEMDDLLLTVLADDFALYKPGQKEGYLNVLKGRLTLKETARPLADTTLIAGMVTPGQSAPVLLFAKTDADGYFSMTLPAGSGNSAIHLKVKGADDLQDLIDYQVEQWEDAPKLKTRKQTNARFDMQHTAGYYRVSKENKLIGQVYNMSALKVLEENGNGLEGHGFRGFDAVYNMNDFQQLPTLRDVIIDIIPDVRVRKSRGHYSLLIDSKGKNSGKLPEDPLILLDGVPVNNQDIIFSLSPADIEKIEVAHASWYFEQYLVHGIFAITTKSKEIHERKDIYHYTYNSVGAPASVGFEFPDYTKVEKASARIPDFRPLLYYHPLSATTEKGEAELQFYTSDDVGTFRIFVEGVTENGKLFSAFKDIEVENPLK